ncbi:MAG: Asp-tRNA(Asn)/Glu-tRNA(Gln) amidotransferase subunit GatA [Candidatus Paceibacterota bacterium]
MDLTKLTIKEAHKKLVAKEITAVDLANAYLKNIQEKNPELNVYLTIFDDVMEQAKKAQEKIDAGTATLLTGIPISMKDNMCMKDRRTTAGSKILENYVAPYSATAILKLDEHCPVYLGKTNTDEFAQGASTENSAYGVTKNPHDTERVAGGSSGGATASVAAEMAAGGFGSDTGGSIREPASFCGVVGLKPTYGSVSRYGLIAMASSFDVISPTAKNVDDVEILFDAVRGKDEMDSTSHSILNEDSSVKTIGVPYDFLKEGIDEDVLKSFNDGIEKLKSEGYEIKDIKIPGIEHSLAVYYVLVPAEVSSNMSRYDGVKFGERIEGKDLLDTYMKTRGQLLGSEVKRRIMLGTYVLSAGYADQFYRKAWQVRNMIRKKVENVFKEVDVIAMPVAPTPAFKIGEKSSDPLKMYLNDIFTVLANVAGVPAISVPGNEVNRDGKNLPVGMQFISAQYNEKKLFEIGKKFEKIK